MKDLFFRNDQKLEHCKALDGLRGIAVLFVMLSHSSNAGIFFFENLNFARTGKIGVYLFFILSAYLLDRQIALVLKKNNADLSYWKNYFLRRFLRIYPLYMIALLVYFFVSQHFFRAVIIDTQDISKHLLLQKGRSIFWSIPVEFKYYIISPLILLICHHFLKWKNNFILILISTLIFSSVISVQFFELSRVSTFKYLPIFLVGTLIAIEELFFENRNNKFIQKISSTPVSLACLFLIILSIPYYFKFIFGTAPNFQSEAFYLPYSVLWGIILIHAKNGSGMLVKFLEFKPIRFLGIISFSLYLFHFLIIILINKSLVELPQDLKIYVFFGLSVLLSTVSYLIFERPLSKIRIRKKS